MNPSNARKRTTVSDAAAAQIRAERAAAELSQDAVVKASGISRSTYLKLESGERVADVSQIASIAAVYGLDLVAFFDRALARVKQADDADAPVLDRTPGRGRGKASDMRKSPAPT